MTLSEILAPTGPEQVLSYPGADGSRLRLLYCKPEGSPVKKLPVLFLIHGGGWEREGPERLLPHIRYFAALGLASFSVEYRLAKRGGPQVEDCLADCAAALRFLEGRADTLGIDLSRLAVAGDSAGGHLACCLANPAQMAAYGFPAPHPSCCINCNGVIDLTMKWKESLFLPENPAQGPDLWLAGYRRARKISPVFHVTAETSPALILHGLADDVVEPEEGARYAAALAAQGVPVEAEFFPHVSHAFLLFDYGLPNGQVFSILKRIGGYLEERGML